MAITHTNAARDIIEAEGEITLHHLVNQLCLELDKFGEIDGEYILSLNITNDTYPKYSYNPKKRLFTYTEEEPEIIDEVI